jgi:hypothetical protein
VSARRRAKVGPLPTSTPPAPRINEDLLHEALTDAFVLLLALDGILLGAGVYTHEDDAVRDGALSGLALALSTKLATIGRQAAGEPEP